MGKQSWKAGNMLNPVPAVMVSVADQNHRPNIITVAWAGSGGACESSGNCGKSCKYCLQGGGEPSAWQSYDVCGGSTWRNGG